MRAISSRTSRSATSDDDLLDQLAGRARRQTLAAPGA